MSICYGIAISEVQYYLEVNTILAKYLQQIIWSYVKI